MIFLNYESINNIQLNNSNYIKETYPNITLSYLPQEILIMLKRMYAGKRSELTAITQYTYQHFVIWREPKLSNLSNNINQIAIYKMSHYEMLAKVLVRCGIDPKNCVYIDGNPNLCDFWKASSVSYEKSLVKMLESDIFLEQRMIQEYNEIINKTDNENLKQILERIIEEDKSYLMYFEAILVELKK